jgi:hypothetical protein
MGHLVTGDNASLEDNSNKVAYGFPPVSLLRGKFWDLYPIRIGISTHMFDSPYVI